MQTQTNQAKKNNEDILTSLPPAVAAVVENFAKSNKIGRPKLAALAAEIMAAPQEKARKISPESATIRAAVLELGENWTSNDVAEKTGITDKVKINNNLTALFKEGVIKLTGETRKAGRGKPSNVWTIA